MDGTRIIPSVDVHAEGEPARILLGGHLQVRGTTMTDRLQWCAEHMDDVRLLLLREPRGHIAMCGVLVLPPVTPTADVAIIILENGGVRPMSGSSTMCAVTAILETGALPMQAPETLVRIDTAVGLVEATATIAGGKVKAVQVRNVPSWVVALDTPVEVHEYGTVAADVAFGGQFFVQAPAAAMGLKLDTENAPAIVRAGAALLAAARKQVPVHHPDDPNLDLISLVMLHGPADEPSVSGRNCVVLPSGELDATRPETWRGSIDRSPCGTGTSARMACLHARSELPLDVPFVHQGVMGTTFEGMLHEHVDLDGHDAVSPSIKGRAWITGINQHVLHPDDPFPRGYAVSDVWGTSEY